MKCAKLITAIRNLYDLFSTH